MKAIVLKKTKDLAVQELPAPEVSPGHVLVAVKYVGLCGTDFHVYLGEFDERVSYPMILGHEFCGEVADIGEGVTGFSIGERVVIDPVTSCGKCQTCLRGNLNVCETVTVIGLDCNGGMCEMIAVPAEKAFHLPASISMRDGVMAELYSVTTHATGRAGIKSGDTVAVLGAGKLGLSMIDMILQTSADRVISVDINSKRLEVAKQIGVAEILNANDCDPVDAMLGLTDGAGADVVVECVGHPVSITGHTPPVQQAIDMLRRSGRLLVMGQAAEAFPTLWRTAVLKEISVETSRLNLGDMPRTLEVMSQGVLHPNLILSHEIPIAETQNAFHTMERGDEEVIKFALDASKW